VIPLEFMKSLEAKKRASVSMGFFFFFLLTKIPWEREASVSMGEMEGREGVRRMSISGFGRLYLRGMQNKFLHGMF